MPGFTPDTDLRAYRAALGAFATGVTVVTAGSATGPVGITANSFASVSLDPALVLWSLAKSSGRFDAFAAAPDFAVHVLGQAQRDMAAGFTRSKDAFAGLDWVASAQGVPLIAGCLARFECQTHAVHDAGDHVIMLGRVLLATHAPGVPLIFHGGQFSG